MFRADCKSVTVPPSGKFIVCSLSEMWDNKIFLYVFLDRVLITACVSLTSVQQANGIQCVTPTEELLFLMMAFLGKEVCFLDDDIKQLLSVRVQTFFDQNKNLTFQLDQQFEGIVRIKCIDSCLKYRVFLRNINKFN